MTPIIEDKDMIPLLNHIKEPLAEKYNDPTCPFWEVHFKPALHYEQWFNDRKFRDFRLAKVYIEKITPDKNIKVSFIDGRFQVHSLNYCMVLEKDSDIQYVEVTNASLWGRFDKFGLLREPNKGCEVYYTEIIPDKTTKKVVHAQKKGKHYKYDCTQKSYTLSFQNHSNLNLSKYDASHTFPEYECVF